MAETGALYGALIDRFTGWAGQQADIRAAVVIGSRARTNRPADEWSDLDVLLITTDPDRYVQTAAWLSEMGKVWLTFLEASPAGAKERRALYAPGLDVDYIPLHPEACRQILQLPQIASVLHRGYQVLLDKDGMFAGLQVPPPQPASRPTQAEFDQIVGDFLYHAVWVAKKLRRGEKFTALGSLGGGMKWLLLRMIEWHARATQSPAPDTWHDGRFLEQWADSAVLEDLPGTFASYEEADLWRALQASVRLFRRLAKETAARSELTYPDAGDASVVAFLEELTPH